MNDLIRYEPDQRCPPWLALVVGGQGVVTVLPIIVLITAITVVAAGQDEGTLRWSVFAALIICGLICALQTGRLGRLGGGHILITGVTPNYIAVSILALDSGGPTVLAGLVMLSGLFYLVVARWLPLLRKVVTPAVSGVVLMLIATSVLPFSVTRLTDIPAGALGGGGIWAAVVTLAVLTLLFLRGRGTWRLWSMFLSVLAGCAVSVPLGIYQFQEVLAAPWLGFPDPGSPGVDLAWGPEVWALAPMFMVVTIVQVIKNIGDHMAVQQVSYRRRKAIDFRSIQGALYAQGVGILLSGIAGTPPTAAYSSSSVSLMQLTGVAARRVGYAMGAILVGVALFPKATAALVSIPNPVMGAVVLFIAAALFAEGLRTVAQSGFTPQTIVQVGLAYAVGVAMMQNNVLVGVLASPWDLLLGDGLTLGAATAAGISLFLRLGRSQPMRLRTMLDGSAYPAVDGFFCQIAAAEGWEESSTRRLRSAAEETLSSLIQPGDRHREGEAPRLIVSAYAGPNAMEMEFLTVVEEENLEDRLAHLNDEAQIRDGGEMSLRLLRHYATDVSHQKYHGMDIITAKVEVS